MAHTMKLFVLHISGCLCGCDSCGPHHLPLRPAADGRLLDRRRGLRRREARGEPASSSSIVLLLVGVAGEAGAADEGAVPSSAGAGTAADRSSN